MTINSSIPPYAVAAPVSGDALARIRRGLERRNQPEGARLLRRPVDVTLRLAEVEG